MSTTAIQTTIATAPDSSKTKTDKAPASRWSRQVAVDIVMIADILAVIIGALLPVTIYHYVGGMEANWILAIQSGFAAGIIAILLYRHWGMYDANKVHALPEYPAYLFAGLFIAFILVLGLGLPYAITDVHVWVWYANWIAASYTLLLLNRIVARWALGHFTAQGRFDKRVAVFGAGPIAKRVHDHLKGKPIGIHFVGVYDDRADDKRLTAEGMDVAGKLADLVDASHNELIDQIIVALPPQADGRLAAITAKLERLPVNVHVVTHIASDLLGDSRELKVSQIGEVGLLDVKKKALSGWAPIIKRTEDIVLGSLFLLISTPLWPFIAAAIKYESNGPVLSRLPRRGFNKRTIELLKFRTRQHEDPDATQTDANDKTSETTNVGQILRRLSLDELPQLINVLKGEMSIVGPRPHLISTKAPSEKEIEEIVIDHYADHHHVKPGITGLAQVNSIANATDDSEAADQGHRDSIEDDIEYIKNWSLLLDMKIMGRTAWLILQGKGDEQEDV